VNVPIGILVVALTILKLKENKPKEEGTGFDIAGAGTLSISLAAILVVLTLGGTYGWISAPTLLLALLSFGALSLFLHVERKLTKFPTLDLSLFTKNRLFAAANATAFLNYVAVNGVTLMMTIYLESIRGFDPQTTGLYLIAQATPMAMLSPLSGWLSDRFGSRLLSSLGMGLVSVGLFLFSQVTSTSPILDVVLRLVLVGIGFGLFSSPNTSAVMGSVKQEKLGVAAGTLGTMRFMGQSIGLALLAAVMATTLPTRALLAVFAGLTAEGGLTVDAFVVGMRNFFLICAGIGTLGTLTSTTRGHENLSTRPVGVTA